MDDLKRRRSESGLARHVSTTREKLDRLKILFNWLYGKNDTTQHIRLHYYLMIEALEHEEIQSFDPQQLEAFENLTRNWKWKQFRDMVRGRVEQLIEGAQQGHSQALPRPFRSFGCYTTQDRSTSWFFVGGTSDWFGNRPQNKVAESFLLRVAENLAGFRKDTVVRCSVCNIFTIRQRAREKQYCSPTCGWAAVARQRRAQRKE